MKNENINYANKITSKMVSDLSKVIEVQEFTLDDLTIIINDLKNEQKEKVIEEIINIPTYPVYEYSDYLSK